MNGKRGLSAVIATVLLILITVAAISLISAFIVPWIKSSLNGSTDCLPYNEYYKFDDSFGYNCYDVSSGRYIVTVTSGIDQELSSKITGLHMKFSNGENSKIFKIESGNTGSCSDDGLGMKNGNSCDASLQFPSGGESKTYVLTSSPGRYASVSVFPEISSGNSKKVCQTANSARLINCK